MQPNSKIGQVFILSLGNGLNVLLNFLALPFLVRTLSYEDYGSYAQVLLLVTFFQGVFTFSLNQVCNFYFSDKSHDPQVVFNTIMWLLLRMALLGSFVFCAGAPLFTSVFKNEMLLELILLSSFNLAAQVFIPVVLSVLYFHGIYNKTTVVAVLINLLKLIVMFLSIHFFNSISVLLFLLSLTSLVQLAFLYFLVPARIRRYTKSDLMLSRSILMSGAPLTMSSLIERSLFHIDGFMISGLLSTSAFALYRAGAMEVPFISGIYGAVIAIVLPEIARFNATGNLSEIVKLKRLAIKATAFFVYPVLVFLLFFSNELISVYLSDRYLQSAAVFSVFNLALFIRVNDFQDVLVLNGHGRFIFGIAVITACLNILLNYFMIGYFGIMGGAVAYIVSLYVFAALLLWKSLVILKCSFGQLVDYISMFKLLSISFLCAFGLHCLILFFSMDKWFVVFTSPLYLVTVFLIGWKMNLLPLQVRDHIDSRYLVRFRRNR